MNYEFMDPLEILIEREEQHSKSAEIARDILQIHTHLLRYLK